MCEYIYIYTPTPNVNISTQLLKKVVQERDDTNQNVDVLQSTPGIYVLNTLSLSLSLYVWLSHGVWKERWSLFKFVVPCDIPFFLPKKLRHENFTPDPKKTSPTCWSDPLPVLQTVWGFFQPHTASGLCKSTNKSNQLASPKHQKVSSIHVLKFFVANTSSGSRPNNLHLEQWRLEQLNRFVLQVDRFLFHWWWYQDHFLVNQKSKRIEDGKVDWCSNLVSEKFWTPDDLCW